MIINGEKVFSNSFKLWELELNSKFDSLVEKFGKDLEMFLILKEGNMEKHLERGTSLESLIENFYQGRYHLMSVKGWVDILIENRPSNLTDEEYELSIDLQVPFEDECVKRFIEFEREIEDYISEF